MLSSAEEKTMKIPLLCLHQPNPIWIVLVQLPGHLRRAVELSMGWSIHRSILRSASTLFYGRFYLALGAYDLD